MQPAIRVLSSRRRPSTLRFLAPCLAAGALAIGACGGAGRPAPTPTPSPSATPTPTATPTSSATPLPTATPTPLPPRTPIAGSAQVIGHGERSRRTVALTFDAGADAGFTAQILDTLKANGIAGTFGITGQWAEQHTDLVRRIASEGHEMINHSYSHSSFTGTSTRRPPLTQAQRWYELDRTEEIVSNLTGTSMKPYFRPPYGDFDGSVNEDVFARGYLYNIMWTVDSEGWRGRSADDIVQICLSLAQPGAIYIFHVGSASQDANALQRVIDGLRQMGYGFATVAQLIAP